MSVLKFISAIETAKLNGGGTFDVDGYRILKDFGYWVGGFQKIVNPFSAVPETPEEMERVAQRIQNLVGDICMSMDAEDAIGLWVSNGSLYVDVSRFFRNLTKAIAAGVLNNQEAIYDIANGRDFSLNDFDVVSRVVNDGVLVPLGANPNPGKVIFKRLLYVDFAYRGEQHTGILLTDVYATDTHAAILDRDTTEHVLVEVEDIKLSPDYAEENAPYLPFVSPRVVARWGKRERVF